MVRNFRQHLVEFACENDDRHRTTARRCAVSVRDRRVDLCQLRARLAD